MTAARQSTQLRTIASALCGILGVLFILVGGFLAFGERALFDSRVFADKAADSLKDPRVSSYAADRLTDAVMLAERDLTMVRPVIHATAEMVVSSAPFRALARRAIRHSHELVLTESGQEILLSVSDVGVVLRSALAVRPDLAEMIPDKVDAVLEARKGHPLFEFSSRLIRMGSSVGAYAQILFWLGIALLLVGLLIAANTKLAVFRAGVGLVVSSLVLLLLIRFGGSVVATMVSDRALGDALAGLWDTFTVGLRHRVLALGGIGILMTSASTAVLEHIRVDAILRTLRVVFWDETEKKSLHLVRAVILISFGALAAFNPQGLVSVLVLLAGGVALFFGLRELFRLVLPPSEEGLAREKTSERRSRRTLRYALAGAIAVTAVIISVNVITRSPAISSLVQTIKACNGYPELADRHLNEVVFPTAHNAMSSADNPGWMFPNHQRGVRKQLEYGIRGLMIDVYAGNRMASSVRTDLGGEDIAKDKYVPMLGEEGVAAALRIRDRLVGGEQEERALYMCHGFCELGAAALVETLADIREFLVMNPHEVLIIIIEDYVEPKEIEAAFEESGLIDFVFRGEPRPPWPTLREMVLADEQVLVLAEHESDGVDWYHQAFEVFQETPYHFDAPESFTNVPNRGGTAGSLLLVNHWITSPPSSLPSNADVVNAFDVLLARARACEKERGMLPNLIAVDFHRTGDLLRVVRTLNGIPDPEDQVSVSRQ